MPYPKPEKTEKKKKRRKLGVKTKLLREADKLFSLKIRSTGHCERCGSTFMLQCAHIVSRRYKQVRWNFNNALCLCSGCHVYFTHHPLEWEIWVIDQIGESTYKELKEKALQHGDINLELIVGGLS
jgi:hypothetical protein